jgi:hypothetical protein
LADTKAKRSKAVKQIPVPVVQDSTFTRAVADRVVPINLGQDLELACLQFGHTPISLLAHETGQTVSLTANLTEVVRLRMIWAIAIDLSLQIIQMGLKGGQIDPALLNTNITNFIEEAKA